MTRKSSRAKSARAGKAPDCADDELSALGDRAAGIAVEPASAFLSEGVWLFCSDCLTVLDALARKYPHGCFDMIFADPPYFLSNGGITCHAGRMVKVNKGDWDRSRGPDLNHEFNREWLRRCQRVLKPDGTIWVSGTHHVIYSVGFAMQQLGFKILNDIAWEKPNPPPNLACRYFTHSAETIIWAARSESSRHYFDYDRMRHLAGGKQMKTVWRLYPPAREEKSFGKHPTQKPVALIERCLEAATREGDTVLDPFMGSGTTGVACVGLGRQFVGIEQDQQWVDVAKSRLKKALAKKGKQAQSTLSASPLFHQASGSNDGREKARDQKRKRTC